MDYQIWIAFSDVMLLVFQLNHFLAFISDFGESKPDLHGPVIHILRKSRTQGLVDIFSDFSNYGCLVAHSRLKSPVWCNGQQFLYLENPIGLLFTSPAGILEISHTNCKRWKCETAYTEVPA